MRHLATIAVSVLLAGVAASPALAGLHVTTCGDAGDGVFEYTFFACAPNINANGLEIRLTSAEQFQDEAIVACFVPPVTGFSGTSTPTKASYFFPSAGPFDCVPALPGDANKFVIQIATADGLTIVEEIWTLDGVEVAGSVGVIACPPLSVEEESWGRVKSLYR